MMWYENIITVLEYIGFKKSDVDPCLLISDKVMCVAYIDDYILFDIYNN